MLVLSSLCSDWCTIREIRNLRGWRCSGVVQQCPARPLPTRETSGHCTGQTGWLKWRLTVWQCDSVRLGSDDQIRRSMVPGVPGSTTCTTCSMFRMLSDSRLEIGELTVTSDTCWKQRKEQTRWLYQDVSLPSFSTQWTELSVVRVIWYFPGGSPVHWCYASWVLKYNTTILTRHQIRISFLAKFVIYCRKNFIFFSKNPLRCLSRHCFGL